MSDTEGKFTGGSGRNGWGMCKMLLSTASPEMFRVNAFRTTGLPVDATTREITKHADKLKMMEELGQGKSVHTGAFALKIPPSVDQIREAMQRLKDPEQRIIDEFFWFWPKQFGNSASDPAIEAIQGGDADTALQTWTALETSPSDGPVAMHNVAILWHLRALEWENQCGKAAELTEENRRGHQKLWREAFKRWALLAVDDLFWNSVTSRINQLDDPRLTRDFARRMRVTLPPALGKINAELAVRYAAAERMDMAQVHIQFMREANQGLDNVNKTAELVLAPTATRLKHQIQRAKERAATNPADALTAARELLDHARRTLLLFELFFGKESVASNELSDEVAGLCNQLPIGYHKATGDDKSCIELLREALPFATSIDLRREIEKNIDTLTGNLTSKQLEPVYAVLKAIQESKALPNILLSKFRTDAVPVMAKGYAGIVGSKEHTELWDGAAGVLRGISLAAWNYHQDMTTAVAANELALEYVRSAELRQRLIADQTFLRQATTQLSTQQTSRNLSGAGCLLCLGLIGVVALFGAIGSNKSSSSLSSTPAVSTPRYVAPSPTSSNNKDIYKVPQAETTELNRDLKAVEAAKAQLEQFYTQIESLGTEIERDRAYLNRNSRVAVDDFNRKVNRYNSMLEQAKSQNRAVNQLVDDYNSKLHRYRQ